jgi:hypothetical protein
MSKGVADSACVEEGMPISLAMEVGAGLAKSDCVEEDAPFPLDELV